MKILQLCTRVPNPPVDGGSIAMLNLEYGLHANGVKLKVLAFNTVKQPVDVEKLDPEYLKMTGIEAVYLDNRISPFEAFFNLFSGESYHVIRFIRRDFEEMLVKTLSENTFDIIQLESLYMVPYIETLRRRSKAKIVLRTHNVEHQIWQRMADGCRNPFKKWYLNLLATRLRKYESWAFTAVDAIVALTDEDKKQLGMLGATAPVFVAPIGVDIEQYNPVPPPTENILFHIGAMDWLPNQEGMDWFLDNVWPLVAAEFPACRLKIAGKRMPERYFKYRSERVMVEEFVPDALEYMSTGRIMVVPLFSGSGMRVKIVEGMAMGKAIVTTPVGLEGIPATDGREVLLATNVDSFVRVLRRCLTEVGLVEKLGQNAREFAKVQFDNPKIGNRLLSFYKSLK